jgi:hypothetical protein
MTDPGQTAALLMATNPGMEPCSCCGLVLPMALWIGGEIRFCWACRPADPDAYHEALIVGAWPPPILAPGWACPHAEEGSGP